MLRYQPEIAAGLESPLVRYLGLPVVPVQLGFDPRLQFLHADDATGAVARCRGPRPGSRPGQRRAKRLDLAEPDPAALRPPGAADPAPAVRAAARAPRSRSSAPAGLHGDGVRLLRYGRGVDNTRLRAELGYEPRYDAVAAVRDLAIKSRGRGVVGDLGLGSLAGRLTGVGS